MAKLGDTTVNGSLDVKGIVTKPSQPAFCGALISPVSIPVIQTFYTIAPWSMRFNQNNNFNATTGIFTASIAGLYQFSANIDVRGWDTASTYYWLRLITSNAQYGNLIAPRYTADLSYRGVFISALADLDLGDTAYLAVYQYSGTVNQTTVYGNANTAYTSFSGFLT